MGEKGENSMVNSSRPSLDSQMELLDVDILSKHPHHTTPHKPSPDTTDRQRCKARNTTPNVIRGHEIQKVDLETPAAKPESRYPKASVC
ncbi:uncharacterized protein Bfra_006792 [Botrytis fragariae]|uniref:Uncharacterized protein n=1 Tax=Botrytis fragariae TaxID=1964551 RepID=A0A8H6EPM6_9HELO|nr:uncharacterized protein Bfra_006792 [Botrytis fragariae]KAF5879585.1 hypothetical protein Bfra_006792 [Botrytis fragariae]